jgi:hypothetical protein
MKWLRKLFAQSAPSPANLPAPVDAEEELSDISEDDWRSFELKLTQLLEEDLLRFAREHEGEEFYALGLDCNAAYCDVLLSANTPEALAASARAYAKDEADASLRAEMDDLRWGFGDWKYHGFNLSGPGDWDRYHAVLPAGDELSSAEDCERFLVAACRALLALENGEAIKKLRRTGDFHVTCIDHDEDYAAGEDRMRSARGTVS